MFLEVHPTCHKDRGEVILLEMSDSDKSALLDVQNETKFPQTIDFLQELGVWLDRVAAKLEEIMSLVVKFKEEAVSETTKASGMKKEAHKRKRIATMATVVSSVAGVGVLASFASGSARP